MNSDQLVLVTGATGHIGRNLVRELHGRAHVRALVREPHTAYLPEHVELVRGDLTDPDSLARAAKGADAVFLLWPLMSTDGLDAVVAALADVPQLVYLSSEGIRDVEDQGDPITNSHSFIEGHLEQHRTQWTFLRPVGFASNTLGWAQDIAAHDSVRHAFPDLARPLVHEADIAAVAARTLTETGHVGQRYVLTGPQHLTNTGQAHAIGTARGTSVSFETISQERERRQMLDAGWPDTIIDLVLAAYERMQRTPEPVTGTVEALTGTPARSFLRWAHEHARDFGGDPLDVHSVASTYVAMCRAGDFSGAIDHFFPDDHVRVEDGREVVGNGAVHERSQDFGAEVDIHSVDIQGPYVGGDRFAVRFSLDTTARATGTRHRTTKLSLYTVDNGRITREEVYYDALEPQ